MNRVRKDIVLTLTEFVLVELDHFLIPALIALITVSLSFFRWWHLISAFKVDKDLETQTVVLVVSEAEPIVKEQEPVGSQAIAIEELVTLSVGCLELGTHRIVDIVIVVVVNPTEVFVQIILFFQFTKSLSQLLPVLDLEEPRLEISLDKVIISLDQSLDHILLRP